MTEKNQNIVNTGWNAKEDKYILRSDLKAVNEWAFLIWSHKAFHNVGAAAENVRSPLSFRCVCITFSKSCSADQSDREGEWSSSILERYGGSRRPLRGLKTNKRILKWTLKTDVQTGQNRSDMLSPLCACQKLSSRILH